MNGNQVTREQAFNIIRYAGAGQTIMLRGQPGVGKTALLHDLARALPDYIPVPPIDVATLADGDLAMPVIDHEKMVTNFAPNARFHIYKGQTKPLLIMLDELTKAPTKSILNMLLPLILDRRLGDIPVPEGSIVFGTGNLETDGVGDILPGHLYNRMTVLDYQNPTNDVWVEWARSVGLDPVIIQCAKETPQWFVRYDQQANVRDKDRNPYIYDPVTGNTKACVTPRSLAKASVFMGLRDQLGDSLLPALVGTVGAPAARLLEAKAHTRDQLPSMQEVLASPATARLPSTPAAFLFMAEIMLAKTDAETIDPFVEYVTRWEQVANEAANLWASLVIRTPRLIPLAMNRSLPFKHLLARLGVGWDSV